MKQHNMINLSQSQTAKKSAGTKICNGLLHNLKQIIIVKYCFAGNTCGKGNQQ